MFYTLYKITNLINGKIYIGVHKTTDLDDGYMGSGTALKRAQEKYGIDNFSKEILHYCDDADEMFLMESKIVNEDFVKDDNTYNIKCGGFGGWDHITESHMKGKTRSQEFKDKVSESALANKKARKDSSDRLKEAHRTGKIKAFTGKEFLGKKHSNETKQKIGKANSVNQAGKKNSQYGTCWVYSLDEKRSKKINKDELEEHLLNGWEKGRRIKFN